MSDLTWLFDIMIPLMMIVLGYLFYKKQPQNINYILGYRTKRSMASKENWIYANKRMGQIWFKLGWRLLILVIFIRIMVPVDSETITVINMSTGLIFMIAPIIIVEKELKKM